MFSLRQVSHLCRYEFLMNRSNKVLTRLLLSCNSEQFCGYYLCRLHLPSIFNNLSLQNIIKKCIQKKFPKINEKHMAMVT